jgi:tRNA(fMet)-specific endonuclease VapC
VSSPPGRTARGILDTSAFIELSRLRDTSFLPAESAITAVTLAELSVGPLAAQDDRQRADRQARLQEAEAEFEALAFDAVAARAFGRVAASLRRVGRKPTARSFDAMIAATAIAHDVPLYTCNPSDFTGIEGLEVIAVPTS